jgi:hypothetical protein
MFDLPSRGARWLGAVVSGGVLLACARAEPEPKQPEELGTAYYGAFDDAGTTDDSFGAPLYDPSLDVSAHLQRRSGSEP